MWKKMLWGSKDEMIKYVVYEIIRNIFTQSFMSVSLTPLRPSNSLHSNYQTHRLHKIQITVTFFN